MNSKSRTLRLGLASALAGVLVGGVAAQGGAGSQASPGAPQAPRHGAGAMMAGQMPMMQARQAAQKRLDDLVAAMNAARGGEKLDAIAAVVTELAAQQKQMSAMCAGMMSHPTNGSEAAAPKAGTEHDSHHQFE